MKSNKIILAAAAAGAFLVLKSRDSGNGKATKAAHGNKASGIYLPTESNYGRPNRG